MSDHDKDHVHGSYYVPDYSWWPILAALALFVLGLGSVEYFGATASPRYLIIGAGMLLLITIGWLTTVIRESRHGLYDAQMHKTFRWGMLWALVSDVMLFATLLGALWYYRIFNLPEISGDYPRMLTHFLLWPTFVNSWPVLVNPDPSQFTGPQQGLQINFKTIITTVVILGSSLTLYLANIGLLRNRRALLNTSLVATFFLVAGFIMLNLEALYLAIDRFGITLSSGIYGSIVIFILLIYLLHVTVAEVLLLVIAVRSLFGHFSLQDDFSIRAFSWFWSFLIVTWLAIFFSIY
jgi:cytochrome c oxidase subunit III